MTHLEIDQAFRFFRSGNLVSIHCARLSWN